MPMHVARPQADDYFSYYDTYIRLVPDETDLLLFFEGQGADVTAFFRDLSEAQAAHRYAEGKWSLKELLGHMTDTERIMTYRLLCVARGDTTPLPSFDENAYVDGASFDSQTVADLLSQFQTARQATVALLRSLTAEQLQRAGTASGRRITAAALVYIVAGHVKHHMNIARERYAPGIGR